MLYVLAKTSLKHFSTKQTHEKAASFASSPPLKLKHNFSELDGSYNIQHQKLVE